MNLFLPGAYMPQNIQRQDENSCCADDWPQIRFYCCICRAQRTQEAEEDFQRLQGRVRFQAHRGQVLLLLMTCPLLIVHLFIVHFCIVHLFIGQIPEAVVDFGYTSIQHDIDSVCNMQYKYVLQH